MGEREQEWSGMFAYLYCFSLLHVCLCVFNKIINVMLSKTLFVSKSEKLEKGHDETMQWTLLTPSFLCNTQEWILGGGGCCYCTVLCCAYLNVNDMGKMCVVHENELLNKHVVKWVV